MRRKQKILTHVWYQNNPHIKIFKDGFPDFSFYPPTAFWEGLKRRHQPIPKFVLSLQEKERVQHGDQSRECRAILRKPMPTVDKDTRDDRQFRRGKPEKNMTTQKRRTEAGETEHKRLEPGLATLAQGTLEE